eukprot:gene1622-1796_t
MSLDENKPTEALALVCSVFDVPFLKKGQEDAIRVFLMGKSIFVSANTGFGKSLIFQSLPIIMDYINDELGYYTLLIVSPLKSLMEGQVKKLGDLGVNAVALSDMTEGGRYEDDEDDTVAKKIDDILECVEEGCYSLVYTSPESMMAKEVWRKISSTEFRRHCIGVAIDEAHWGIQQKEDQCRFKNGIYNILVVLDEVFGDIEEDISDLDLVELSEDDENAVCPEWQCIRDDTALVNLGDSDLEVYLDSIIDKMDISAEEDSFNM